MLVYLQVSMMQSNQNDRERTWSSGPVTRLHIELSNHCNAACPMCPRYVAGTEIVNPELKLSRISIEEFRQWFKPDFVRGLERIIYCGTNGDPIMAKDCLEIFQYVSDLNPRCEQTVHTNGGVRDAEFWSRMGELSTRANFRVVWSIDGLELTNHIYRRRVHWPVLERNFRAFIASGGRAIWEFLIFSHNEHQVKQAQRLSKEWGFEKFLPKQALGFENPVEKILEPRMVYDADFNMDYKIYPPQSRREWVNCADYTLRDSEYYPDQEPIRQAQQLKFWPRTKQALDQYSDRVMAAELDPKHRQQLDQAQPKCRSLSDQGQREIYVSAEGWVMPCCFVATRVFGNIDTGLDYQLKMAVLRRHGSDLDLHLNPSLEHILYEQRSLDRVFADSWTRPTVADGKLGYCSETCGQASTIDRIYSN